MKTPFLRTEHNYDRNEASQATALRCTDPTRTQQHFAEECDINFIAKRYGLTGELPTVLDLPKYGDFEGVFDFQTAQNSVRHAIEQFMTLPAHLRKRFENQPQKLLEFLEDPANAREAEFLGLTQRPSDLPESPQAKPAGEVKGEVPTPAAKPAGDASTEKKT